LHWSIPCTLCNSHLGWLVTGFVNKLIFIIHRYVHAYKHTRAYTSHSCTRTALIHPYIHKVFGESGSTVYMLSKGKARAKQGQSKGMSKSDSLSQNHPPPRTRTHTHRHTYIHTVFGEPGSSVHRLSKGMAQADSLSWNPHKMMGAPLQTSAFLCARRRDDNGMRAANSCCAHYCFQEDKVRVCICMYVCVCVYALECAVCMCTCHKRRRHSCM
jgi:hypothetical protein